jgi:CBS domain-containing protein
MSDDELKGLSSLKKKAKDNSVAESPCHEFMSKSPVQVPHTTKVYNAIQMLAVHKVGSAPVVDGQDKVIGVISEHDLLIQTATKDVADTIDFVKSAVVIKRDQPLKDVLVVMFKKKFRRLPVVDEKNRVIGIVTRMDILLKLIGQDRGSIK